jgi:hypothetical protein
MIAFKMRRCRTRMCDSLKKRGDEKKKKKRGGEGGGAPVEFKNG